MKTILFVLLFNILLVFVEPAVSRISHNPADNHRGHCYAQDIGPLEKGEIKRLEGSCQIAICGDNRDIEIQGCGTVGTVPPCYVVKGDLSKPHPECCAQIECGKPKK